MSGGKSISYPHHHAAATSASREATTAADQLAGAPQHQSRPDLLAAMTTCYPSVSYEQPRSVVTTTKDYSRPLHVDCSVEYELPNAAKPPQGVRNEPLLMIHPCYFRKIESQRRSPFINNLPARPATALKRRTAIPRGQQLPQQVPVQAAPYPVQYQTQDRSIWDPQPPPQPYCKRDVLQSACAAYTRGETTPLWPDPADCSPERPEDKHILSGKYRQYLRAHRLHPYVSSFPHHQIQQVCYNV